MLWLRGMIRSAGQAKAWTSGIDGLEFIMFRRGARFAERVFR
jgi:hypothetical protein